MEPPAQPGGEIGRGQLPHPGLVTGDGVAVEDLPPLAAGPPVEELLGALPDPVVGVGGDHLGLAAHLAERGGLDQGRPAVVRHLDVEPGGQAPHLAFGVPLQVVVVEEDDVGPVAHLPKAGQVVDHPRQAHGDLPHRGRIVDPVEEGVLLVGEGRAVRRRAELVAGFDRGRQRGEDRVQVDVVEVPVPGQGDVPRVPPDADVGDALPGGQPVEGGVALDEPPVRLGLVEGEHVRAPPQPHLEPRRDLVEGPGKRRRLEDEQPADHLRPGGAALRRGADDDVPGTDAELLPTGGIDQEA